MSSPGDTGCAMFIRAGILGKKDRHSHHFYSAGMSSMFDKNMKPVEFGIEPDVPVQMTFTDMSRNIDTMIEAARALLR